MKSRISLEEKIRFIMLEENPGVVFIKEILNDDEYDGEIAKIIQLLEEHTSESEFVEQVNKLFLFMFSGTGTVDKFKDIAKKIWFVSRKEDQIKLLG